MPTARAHSAFAAAAPLTLLSPPCRRSSRRSLAQSLSPRLYTAAHCCPAVAAAALRFPALSHRSFRRRCRRRPARPRPTPSRARSFARISAAGSGSGSTSCCSCRRRRRCQQQMLLRLAAACSLPSLTPPHRPRPYGVNFVRAQILNLHFAWTRSRRRRARCAPGRQHCALLCDARAPAVTTCRARTYDRGGHVQEGASHRSPRSASRCAHLSYIFISSSSWFTLDAASCIGGTTAVIHVF